LVTSPAVREEFTTSEAVHQIELSDDVDQAQELAEPVTDGVHAVLFEVSQQIVDEDLLLHCSFLSSLQTAVETKHDRLHQTTCEAFIV